MKNQTKTNKKTKMLFCILITVFCFLPCSIFAQVSVWDGTQTTWTNGTGTQSDPYLIENAQQLAYLAYYVNNGGTSADQYWKQTIDIDLNSLQWTSIGSVTYEFLGHFNGNGKTIANLNIKRLTLSYVGLFGRMNGGSIKNIGVIGTFVLGAGVLGHSGGIVGLATNCTIENCYRYGNGTTYLYNTGGGIVGSASNVTINYCYNIGNIETANGGSEGSTGGGIIGNGANVNINNCYNVGEIYSYSSESTSNYVYAFAGGIIGKCYGNNYVNNCYNVDRIYSKSENPLFQNKISVSGGIVGSADATGSVSNGITIRNCYNRGEIVSSPSYNSAGIIPVLSNSISANTIINCYNTGSASNAIKYGASGTVTNCYACAGSFTYGGSSVTAAFMKTQDFVNLLNNGPVPNNAYALDNNVVNGGFAILLFQLPPVPPIITTTSLPNGITGTSYNQQLAATSNAPITWTLVSGTLPTGLTLSESGLISGTPNTTGTFEFTIQASNVAGSNTKTLSITILEPPTITTTTLQNGVVSTAYSAQLTATGATPITWSLESGALPPDLTISESGLISGTPTTPGVFEFTIKASNVAGSNTKTLSITIDVPLIITTTTLQNGVVDTAYSTQLTATGATAVTWSLESGSLPTGLTISTSGLISGTPTVANTFKFTVKASNSWGSTTKTLEIKVIGLPEILTTSLPDGVVGVSYYAQIFVLAGGALTTVSIDKDKLPNGLDWDLNITSGVIVISGKPTTVGVFNFTLDAINVVGGVAQNFSITITTSTVAPTITTTTLPNGKINTAYSKQLSATGSAPITWSLSSGSLPNGLTLSSTGRITGTSTTAGISNFTVKATNSAGSDTKELFIIIDGVGISENEIRDIKIYPNPTTRKLSIVSEQLSVESVEIFDVYGRKQQAERRRSRRNRNGYFKFCNRCLFSENSY